MKRLIPILLTSFLCSAHAGELTLDAIRELDQAARDSSERIVASYLAGYADALMVGVILGAASVGLEKGEAAQLTTGLYKCFRKEAFPITYARLLVAAEENPNQYLHAWAQNLMSTQCQSELAEIKGAFRGTSE